MLAVLYDIHANLPALEAVLADARAKGATAFLLGGDLVGFGPFQRETLAALRQIDEPTICIRGNGERWLREPPLDRPEILGNLGEHVARFSEEEVERLYRLPPRAEVDGVVYVHGCWWSDVDSFAREPQEADELRAGPLDGADARLRSLARAVPARRREGQSAREPGLRRDAARRRHTRRLGIVGRRRLHAPPHRLRRRAHHRSGRAASAT